MPDYNPARGSEIFHVESQTGLSTGFSARRKVSSSASGAVSGRSSGARSRDMGAKAPYNGGVPKVAWQCNRPLERTPLQ